MPASISRPGIGPINIDTRVFGPQGGRPASGVNPRVTSNGAFIDNRSPGQAARNVENESAGLRQFLEQVGKAGATIAQGVLANAEQTRAGNILSSPEAMEIIGGTNDRDAKRLLLGMSPDTKNQIYQVQANDAAMKAVERIQLNYSTDAQLRDDRWVIGAKDADIAAKFQQLEANAEVDKLNVLVARAPQATAAAVSRLQQVKSALRMNFRKEAVEKRVQNVETLSVQQGIQVLDVQAKSIEVSRVASSGDVRLSEQEWQAQEGVAVQAAKDLKALGDQLGTPPSRLYGRLVQSTMTELKTAFTQLAQSGSDDPAALEARDRLASRMVLLQRIGDANEFTVNGVSVLDQIDDNGVSIRQKIAQLMGPEYDIALERANAKANEEMAADATLEAFYGSATPPEAAAAIRPMVEELRKTNPKLALDLQNAAIQGASARQSMTEQGQARLERDAQAEILAWRKANPDAPFTQEMKNSLLERGLRMDQVQDLEAKVEGYDLQQKGRDAQLVNQFAGDAQTSLLWDRWLQHARKSGYGKVPNPDDQAGVRRTLIAFDEKLRQQMMLGVAEFKRSNGGKDPELKDFDGENGIRTVAARQAYLSVAGQLFTKPAGPEPMGPPTPAQQAEQSKQEVSSFVQDYLKSGGKVTPAMFAPDIVKEATSNGKFVGERALRILGSRMESAKDAEGRPVFNLNGMSGYQFLWRELKRAGDQSSIGVIGADGVAYLNQATQAMRQYGFTDDDLGFTAMLGQRDSGGGSLASAATEVVTDAVEAPPPPEKTADVVVEKGGRMILDLAGVAKEEEGPEGPVPITVVPLNASPDNVRRLGRIYSGQEPLRPDTAPLPQAPAEAPALRIPLSMKNNRHPWIEKVLTIKAQAISRRRNLPAFVGSLNQEPVGSFPDVAKVIDHPDTGKGWTVPGQKDANGRPVVLSRPAANAFSAMIAASGGVVRGSDIASAQRSKAKNASLPKASSTSKHLTGAAMDIHGRSGEWMKKNGAKFGWFLIDYEGSHGGHFEFRGVPGSMGGPPPPRNLGAIGNAQAGRDVIQQQFGFPRRGAAWLAGNIQAESSWRGQRTWDDVGKPAGGLVSWRAGRLREIERRMGKTVKQASHQEQLQAMVAEMKEKFPKAYSIFMNPNATESDLISATKMYWGYGTEGQRYTYARQLQ